MRLILATAEPSGDALGAALLRAMREQGALREVRAAAGPALVAEGAGLLAPASDATASGLIELVGHLPRLLRHRRRLLRALDDRPDLLVTVDSPGLHLPIAREAKRRGIPVVHAVCPQIWASRPWRVRTLRRSVDHVLCLLPFEPSLLAKHRVPSTFIGHPAARAWGPRPAGNPTILIAPGSRPSELHRHLPVLAKVVSLMRARRPEVELLCLRAPGLNPETLAPLGCRLVADLGSVTPHAALVASGTITLELATAGIPQVVLYRVHPITYLLGRPLLNTPWIALPNILAGRPIVPEHLQDLDPSRLVDELCTLLGPAGEAQREALRPVIAAVRHADGLRLAAELLWKYARRSVAEPLDRVTPAPNTLSSLGMAPPPRPQNARRAAFPEPRPGEDMRLLRRRKVLSASEIDEMRKSCRLAAETLMMVGEHLKAGMTTDDINTLVHEFIVSHGAYPSPLNYKGFPKSVCTSVNEVVCHGIPGPQVLKDGDIINVDVTTLLPAQNGFHGDTSLTFYIGEPPPQIKHLVEVTRECLELGIAQVKPGARVGDIGAAIQAHAEAKGCSVVREYTGHGIHRIFHDEPTILHYGKPGTGARLEKGMTFTIEPMINLGGRAIEHLDDGWTVLTRDRSPSAQFEHTVLVTKSGCEVLTRRPGLAKHSEDVPWARLGPLSSTLNDENPA